MKTKILILAIVLFSLIPFASAISSQSCDIFSMALSGDSVKTDVSGNGNTIAVGGVNGMIGSFTPDGSPRWSYRISDPVTGIATSDDGRFIAATTFSGDLYYFDDKGRFLWNISGFGCNSQVALSGDGQEGYVFSRSPTRDFTGNTVFHFSGNGSVLSRLPIPAPTSYALSADGRVAVVNSGGIQGRNSVVAIDDDGIRWQKIRPNPWRVPLVAVSDNANTIAAAEPGELTAFSGHGRELWNITTKYIARSVAVSGDGQYILAGTQYQVVNFNRSGSLVWEYPVPDYAGHVRASKDGSRIVATTRQTLYYLDHDGTALWQYAMKDWTESLSISDYGDVVAAGTYNNTFTLFDGRGNAREIVLDTVPVMPVVTRAQEPNVNTSVAPTRSQAAAISLVIAVIGLVGGGILLRTRKSCTKTY
ncbi:PQQ-binding-like beta-propeller repeat protein [Methanoregula sp.]|uniref:WD40 repeat domain-containing protein n=1 Tax=Methanoregula sp. TaxID=2052170 RepID=UPI00261DA8BE|nr:PQQ-binding-like beta-propeller repeat protein [Methanoregula sp.]MDD5142977.1 PQQ-binding-like beta-propeller repeat protein [Methanoregula sp.]